MTFSSRFTLATIGLWPPALMPVEAESTWQRSSVRYGSIAGGGSLRDAATAGSACSLAAQGVQIIRVHAVGLVRSALDLFAATR